MKNLILISLAIAFFLVACNKQEKTPAVPNTTGVPYNIWSSYMGTYDVYDTINNTQWVMKMTHLYHFEQNNGNNDSVLIENFANKFNIRFRWMGVMTETKKPAFGVGPFHPIKDFNNNSWHLGGWWDDTTTVPLENVLKNDTLTTFFTLSNIAFYTNDNVPYYACDCKHVAVKHK